MTNNATDVPRCTESVWDGRSQHHRCWRPAHEDGKCRVHCASSVERRRKKTDDAFNAKMRNLHRRASNETLGVLARQIILAVEEGRLNRENVYEKLVGASKKADGP